MPFVRKNKKTNRLPNVSNKNSKSKIIYFNPKKIKNKEKYRFGSHVNVQLLWGLREKQTETVSSKLPGRAFCLSLSLTHTVWCVIDVAGEDDGWAWVIATAYCSLIWIETSRDWLFP